LSGAVSAALKPKLPPLAVHDDHARADLLHELVVGGLDLRVGRRPARHALLDELIERIGWEELAGRATRSAGLQLVAADRADAKVLPGLLLRAEQGLAREDLGVAGPGRAPALDRVGDVDVVAGAQEEHLPAWLAVRLGLPGDAGEPAAVPEQQGILRLGLGELDVLHVHLLDLEVPIGIDLDRRRAGREHDVLVGSPDSEAARPPTWKLPTSATDKVSAAAMVEVRAAMPSTSATMRMCSLLARERERVPAIPAAVMPARGAACRVAGES
jgi:hypothetical protein